MQFPHCKYLLFDITKVYRLINSTESTSVYYNASLTVQGWGTVNCKKINKSNIKVTSFSWKTYLLVYNYKSNANFLLPGLTRDVGIFADNEVHSHNNVNHKEFRLLGCYAVGRF
jgi:hypothetical protein